MLNKPQLNPCFSAEIIETEGVFLFSERHSFFLGSNSIYRFLIPLLDGQHSPDEIVDLVLPNLSLEKASAQDFFLASACVYHALMQMEQEGYLIEGDDGLPAALKLFITTLVSNISQESQPLQVKKVGVTAFGRVDRSSLVSALESLQISVSQEGAFDIVLTDDYLREELKSFNKNALRLERPWMLLKPVGTIIWIGPIFYPGRTACWECLAHRLRENRPVEGYVQRHQKNSSLIQAPVISLPHIVQISTGMAATEIAKWLVRGSNPDLEGTLVTLDILSLQTERHSVILRPQCPCCGSVIANDQPLPLVLGNRKKKFTADGGHRCIPPEETWKKYEHFISPITGVIRNLKPLTGMGSLCKSYIASHHQVTSVDDLLSLNYNVTGRSSGKGMTDIQAKVSALCESIERYSGIFQGDESRHKSSLCALGDLAVHPNQCLNFSQAQYDNRKEWNYGRSGTFQKVPEPFDDKQAIDWSPVWSLKTEDFKYLPTAYCYYGYPSLSQPFCWADSNGCAAGNTLEEAILQGFMELVERDSIALWWYNRVKRPQVDLSSFNEPYFQALEDYHQTLNRELWVIDLTSDLNIPVFAAISKRIDRSVEDITFGFGAHFDPRIALLRALTEISQTLASVLSANPDGSTRYPELADKLAVDWWQSATVANQSYLLPAREMPLRSRSDYAYTWNENLREDIMACQQIVEARGMEMLVLDQSRPDIGLKVVRVIVPGMRSHARRLGDGRLYDVPTRMGWLTEPLQEHQLNPWPMWV